MKLRPGFYLYPTDSFGADKQRFWHIGYLREEVTLSVNCKVGLVLALNDKDEDAEIVQVTVGTLRLLQPSTVEKMS